MAKNETTQIPVTCVFEIRSCATVGLLQAGRQYKLLLTAVQLEVERYDLMITDNARRCDIRLDYMINSGY